MMIIFSFAVAKTHDLPSSLGDHSDPHYLPTASQGIDLPKTLLTQIKRDIGCIAINSTTYQTSGSTFDILCDTAGWGSLNILQITYTLDFVSCINDCVIWNTQNTQKCMGVEWVNGQYGPDGIQGGSECYFFWVMIGNGAPAAGYDSAKLQVPQSPTVYP
jgi:hypothetical protein